MIEDEEGGGVEEVDGDGATVIINVANVRRVIKEHFFYFLVFFVSPHFPSLEL